MPRKKTTPEELPEQLEQVSETTELPEAQATAEPQPEALETLPVENPDAPVQEADEAQEEMPEDDGIPEIVSVVFASQDADENVDYSLAVNEPNGAPAVDALEAGYDDGPPADAAAFANGPASESNSANDSVASENGAVNEPAQEPVSTPKRRTAAKRKPAEAAETQAGPVEGPSEQASEDAAPTESERKSFWQLDFHELDRDLSPDERQEWNSIYASYRGRSAITGTVVGVDRHAINVRDKATGQMVRQEMYCAIVIPFRVRIVIPETEMWFKGEERPGFVLRNIVGASVDFVVIHVDREAGFAIGSRRLALSSRRYYFSTQPTLNRPGARVKCKILAVGPRRCLVNCYGYDVNLTQREMRYTAIPDLRDEYHPGQELDCVVKGFEKEAGQLSISVKDTNPNPFDGAELRHPVGCRRQAAIAGKYAGGVFCNLTDGVVVMCSYSSHYNDAEFAIGDKVILVVQHFEMAKKQIYGKIVAKW